MCLSAEQASNVDQNDCDDRRSCEETNVKPEQSCEDEFSLDEIEKILRDLEACVEDSDAETLRAKRRETDSETAAEIVRDAREFEAAQTGRSLDDSERNVSERKQDLLKEAGHKAEIRSSDLKIQNAQITRVRQYKLQTTESYFRTQDEESPGTKSGLKERNQAYLDMYALLAESTTTRLNRDDGGLSHDGKNVQQNRSKGRSKAKNSYYDVNESNVSEFSDKTTGLNDGEDGELKLNGPWVKIKSPDEVYEAEETPYWSLCRGKPTQKASESPTKTRSPVKPSLPKKPDLGILGLLNKTAKRADPVERTSPGKAQNASSNQNSNSPRREKPPIVHKKPNLATQSPTKERSSGKSDHVWTSQSTTSGRVNEVNVEDLEAILEERVSGFNGFAQNGCSDFNKETSEQRMWSLEMNGHFGESRSEAVWKSSESDEAENSVRFENSWMEKLENLGSCRKSRVASVENPTENIWCPRNANCVFTERDGRSQAEFFGSYGQQNVNVFGRDFTTETETKKIPMKKPPRTKRNQSVLASQSESSRSSSSSSSDSDRDVRAIQPSDWPQLLLAQQRALHGQSEGGAVPARPPDPGAGRRRVTVAAQTRSTDDLFAVIHRSKRKMFGRKDSGFFSSSSSSSSPSPPVTPTDPCPAPEKGVHFGSVSRVSAVERLCRPSQRPQQRPLTPTASGSRWVSSRTRLAPMAAILERHEEEREEEEEDDDDDDVLSRTQFCCRPEVDRFSPG
ncbi:hypothetical protein WMY93_032637 [Mugilogobius chulae]|uniref:Uncharacterized protein n=1 Tax=Mugilogobius chulae TaxID=88201 RepID=A0AAW0MJ19_9GOBI